ATAAHLPRTTSLTDSRALGRFHLRVPGPSSTCPVRPVRSSPLLCFSPGSLSPPSLNPSRASLVSCCFSLLAL
uniref:Uncharacterized protein n=1 Tax=Aegilops tauschii subsp. strangulata TaxID=200361 RepID=A0A453NNN6_AEGTS